MTTNPKLMPLLFVLCGLAWLAVVSGVIGGAKDGPAVSDDLTEFARQTLEEIQAESFENGREYCGVIYRTARDTMERSRIFEGDESSCEFRFEETPAKIALASFHTHGAATQEYDTETPSLQDFVGDVSQKVVGYVATPGGRFWVIDWDERRASQVCGEGCLSKDPDYRPCRAYPPAESYTLDELRERAENDKGAC